MLDIGDSITINGKTHQILSRKNQDDNLVRVNFDDFSMYFHKDFDYSDMHKYKRIVTFDENLNGLYLRFIEENIPQNVVFNQNKMPIIRYYVDKRTID